MSRENESKRDIISDNKKRNNERKFTLFEIFFEDCFVILKNEEINEGMDLTFHGFMHIIENIEDEGSIGTQACEEWLSDELKESGEYDLLSEEAIDIASGATDDEFDEAEVEPIVQEEVPAIKENEIKRKYKLVEILIGLFAITGIDEEIEYGKPFKLYGFIGVFLDEEDNERFYFLRFCMKYKFYKELLESGELKLLCDEAADETTESIVDLYRDWMMNQKK